MKELDFINRIRKTCVTKDKAVLHGIGDDCAVLKYNKDKYMLWASDMIVEGTHFDTRRARLSDIGYKAVAVNVSDIAAMGGKPEYILVSLGMPPARFGSVGKIYKGMKKICRKYGIDILGGDTNRSDKIVIDISIIGFAEKKRLVTRSGARPGDLIMITGPIRDGRKVHLTFEPRLKEARYLVENYKITSMIDVSDGIATDMWRICQESGTGCVLLSEALPLSRGLTAKEALYGGECFELLFTMPKKEAIKLKQKKPGIRGKYSVIGEVTKAKGVIKMIREDGHMMDLSPDGFDHFKKAKK